MSSEKTVLLDIFSPNHLVFKEHDPSIKLILSVSLSIYVCVYMCFINTLSSIVLSSPLIFLFHQKPQN